ncbi:response regulator receiver domain-containing protein [Mangrovibacterium marinum]|uniref:Response regulator receiver domain-containing protein n=2 Tax=Mangrovibacterium marinum TaxID=1639118 RepID=A0A2T5C6M6_9BACT|nr:response regulator receiver domain-containing protein [Mangrovibacterium marinum]
MKVKCMKTIRILWTDDEIDLLRPHIIFLEQKGYQVSTSSNGSDAIDLVRDNHFDIIFLDENMPGLTGLQTLTEIKNLEPNVPVVMITKSEEEDIMDQAIGSKIADYLIKPVNPKQILLSIKKNVDQHELVTRKTTSDYQSEFGKIGMRLNERLDHEDWKEVYRKLVFWELELSASMDSTMDEILQMQKAEANNNFSRYIKNNYLSWFEKDQKERPMLSPDLFRHKIFPLLNKTERVFVLVIDNLRYDQFRVLSKVINQYFLTEEEELYYSILPTATMYARNAIFAGLMPSEIARIYPNFWEEDDNESHKNVHEKELLQEQMKRLGRSEKMYFEKVGSLKTGKKFQETLTQVLQNNLSVMVFNFVDMISHARTDTEVMRELASDEKAYRSLTLSWFNHSFLLELLKSLAENQVKVVITTDHGTVRVNNALKVVGDRETVTNLRYKLGRNLNYNPKEVFEIAQPEKAFLPGRNVSSRFIFACNDDFLAYPNNYNHYVQYYRDTFQHGGISMEEMIVPVVTLKPKS